MNLMTDPELWKSKGQLRKAAALYEKGGHFRDASECFHAIGEFEQAIEVLRRGDVFDELINYMNRYVFVFEHSWFLILADVQQVPSPVQYHYFAPILTTLQHPVEARSYQLGAQGANDQPAWL